MEYLTSGNKISMIASLRKRCFKYTLVPQTSSVKPKQAVYNIHNRDLIFVEIAFNDVDLNFRVNLFLDISPSDEGSLREQREQGRVP